MEPAAIPKPPPRARYWNIGWDWTDIALFLPLAIALSVAGVAVIGAVAYGIGRRYSPELQTAILSTAITIAIYLAAAGAIAILVLGRRRQHLRDLGWRLPWQVRTLPWWIWILIAAAAAVLSIVVATLLAYLNALPLPQQPNGQCIAVRQEFGSYIALAIPVICLVVPIVEESLFRGFIYGWLRKRLRIWPAVVLISAIFALAHMEPLLFLPLFFVGMVLAFLYEVSRSLLPGAIVHGLFNLYGIIGILAPGNSC